MDELCLEQLEDMAEMMEDPTLQACLLELIEMAREQIAASHRSSQ